MSNWRNILITAAAFALLFLPAKWVVDNFHALPYFSVGLTLLAVVAVVMSRLYLQSFPKEDRVAFGINGRIEFWSKIAVGIGALLIVLSVAWIPLVLPLVSNDVKGAIYVFVPAFAFLFCGLGLLLFWAFIWLFGERG